MTEVLWICVKGLIGVFAVIAVIMACVALLNRITRPKPKPEPEYRSQK